MKGETAMLLSRMDACAVLPLPSVEIFATVCISTFDVLFSSSNCLCVCVETLCLYASRSGGRL